MTYRYHCTIRAAELSSNLFSRLVHFSVADENGDGELTLDEVIKLQKGVFQAAKIGFKVGFT